MVLLNIPMSEIKTQMRSYIKIRLFIKERENRANKTEKERKGRKREGRKTVGKIFRNKMMILSLLRHFTSSHSQGD